MSASDKPAFARELDRLEAALNLPDAHLKRSWLDEEVLALWLLDIKAESTRLDTQAIGRFWQQLPFWAFAWAGGRALASWIAAHPDYVTGKTVLDFGCGSGIVGIAAALAGAKQVWVADLDPNALEIAHINAALNGVEVYTVMPEEWPEVDVLLAADVLYDISSSEDLRRLTASVPEWLLAESRAVAPDFVSLQCLDTRTSATLPAIGDFDEEVNVDIYCRSESVTLN